MSTENNDDTFGHGMSARNDTILSMFWLFKPVW